ncbi:hypothetical protein BJ742DRAFT_744900 [Cladochytrium replicatum]|nr:hypothetical protein BJ742DRAFT_744900 [Cladochytrium replicatum]
MGKSHSKPSSRSTPPSSNAPIAQQQARRVRSDTAEIIVHDEVEEKTDIPPERYTPSPGPIPQPTSQTPQSVPAQPQTQTTLSAQQQQPPVAPLQKPSSPSPPPSQPQEPPPSRQWRSTAKPAPTAQPQEPPMQTKYAFGSPDNNNATTQTPQTSAYTAFIRFFSSDARPHQPTKAPQALPAAQILDSEPTLFNAEDLEEEMNDGVNARYTRGGGGLDIDDPRPVVVRMHVVRAAVEVVAAEPVAIEVGDEGDEDSWSVSGSMCGNRAKAKTGDKGHGGDADGRVGKGRAMHVVENSHPFGLQKG